MKYFLIAGEASGDLHASNLMKALKAEDREAGFRFFGGDLMQSVGGVLVKHYSELAYMGIIPVLLHLPAILRNLRLCREEIQAYHPDVVILIDYPGFNLKMAKFIKNKLHLPVYYYISPKIWAWKKYRIKSFRKYVDRMFCIFPFEEDFYKSLDYPVDYVGNPTVDSVAEFMHLRREKPDFFLKENHLTGKPILAVLAGSRKDEIRKNLPAMLAVASGFSDYQTVIAGAPGLTHQDYQRVMGGKYDTPVVYGQTYDLLQRSAIALVTSGTATLETALFHTPQVVCYHVSGGKLVNFVFNRFFHVPYISLVNLIANEEVVQELFGAKFSCQTIRAELSRIIEDNTYRQKMLTGYDRVISLLGPPGASQRTAAHIVRSLMEERPLKYHD